MGSKTIIFFGVLLSALYLYFCISKYAVSAPIVATNVVKEVVPTEEVVVTSTVVEDTNKSEEDVVVQNANERISTPAFGFMAGKKNQIVALMSDNDESGELSKEINTLCEKSECSKDMRYETDIQDAAWQNATVKIIGLLTDGSIENGSLFIESNVLKIEGKIKDQEAQNRLDDILNSVKSDTFKVENHSKLSDSAQRKKSEIKKSEPVKKEIVVEKVEIKPQEVKKVEQKPLPVIDETPVYIPVISEESTMDTTLDTQSQIIVEDSIDEKIEAVETVAKPYVKTSNTPKKIVKKKVVKARAVPKREIVAAPVMETTLDAEARVRAILSEIRDTGAAVGLVATPHMETTAE